MVTGTSAITVRPSTSWLRYPASEGGDGSMTDMISEIQSKYTV